MKLDRAIGIEGFMYEADLKWLAQQAKTKTRICEIGSWKGRSTAALADNTDGLVYAIDTFEGSDHPALEEARRYKVTHPDSVYSQFRANLSDHVESGKLQIIIDRSDSAARTLMLAGLRFDMIFIDGAHEYEQVSNDIVNYSGLLAEGGLLCGHDAHYDPVKNAVKDHVGKFNVPDGLSIWVAE